MERSSTNISVGARVAAISALLIASLVLIVALVGVLDGGGDSSTGDRPALTNVPKNYEVRSGDTLTAISEKTGVPTTTIEELNPGIDPQALIEGQKLKLR